MFVAPSAGLNACPAARSVAVPSSAGVTETESGEAGGFEICLRRIGAITARGFGLAARNRAVGFFTCGFAACINRDSASATAISACRSSRLADLSSFLAFRAATFASFLLRFANRARSFVVASELWALPRRTRASSRAPPGDCPSLKRLVFCIVGQLVSDGFEAGTTRLPHAGGITLFARQICVVDQPKLELNHRNGICRVSAKAEVAFACST